MPITNRADAVKAANELLPQINRDSSISSRMEYLSRIAELKNLIPKNDLKIADVWDRYLNSASRPDSGEKTLAFYQTAFDIFKNWLHENHSEKIFVRQIDCEVANEFAMYYWRTGISERTYNARICALKLIFKILLKTENPFAEIRHKTELQQSRKAFTAEQLKTIFAKLEEPDYYMLFKDEMRLMILIMLESIKTWNASQNFVEIAWFCQQMSIIAVVCGVVDVKFNRYEIRSISYDGCNGFTAASCFLFALDCSPVV
jgi:hypothetical protein